ncbi:methyl-accepting chemotaxis sensory transducer [Desulfatibacillum alkenivorans DSM 16219]|jgi:methyl-accepting chemotaxis protein|uniref:Methyl-accepting chemotaxis sensory transducer n=1 Tax=Desulfatibacillum alkenivorans DSM 16219 TaxID=1121393 RepID=A0A1M6PWR3_9BACT|nr:methyl-accepting chemotaxis protein [Desulfatibacillum alkenivorans]SHK12328.1 methyl-accepting chemotaxis sensory transducer [Desulfatibacillum alkenivorans DSM 16219]
MQIKKINFSSISARIILFAVLAVGLMVITLWFNGLFARQKTHYMELERASHQISRQVMEGMRYEALYINDPSKKTLDHLGAIEASVQKQVKELSKKSKDSKIQSLTAKMSEQVLEHKKRFEEMAFNVKNMHDDQNTIIDKITLTEGRFQAIIDDVNMKEAMLLMESGQTLDPTRTGLRNETKDILRLGDELTSNIQALLLKGDEDFYKKEVEAFKDNVALRSRNIETTLKTLKSEKYDKMWKTALTEVPNVLALEAKIHTYWKEIQRLEQPLQDTQNKLLKVTEDISKYSNERINASSRRQGTVSVLSSLVSLGALLFLAFALSRSIIMPVNRVVASLKEISQGGGDLASRLPEDDKGEMGELARCFNQFMSTLHGMIMDITMAANSLAAFTADVTSTAAQMAASAAEETTTVTEVSTTTEEVKQTVSLSNEKAEQVTHDADSMVEVSQKGMEVTEEAAAGMDLIREEMESIAQSIMQLSNQTLNIEEIINSVNEIANQSDLLSVNASIEAAKAGEFGKGFAVVAQEVKNLANQSKQSTAQVRQLLGEIHKATNDAILAAERGAKAVEKGVALSGLTGDTIKKLSASIEASVRSAQQIASSCRQQLAGMEQLDMAMKSIKDASGQNLESSQRLEQLTLGLQQLGDTLEDKTSRFKL